MKLTLADLGLSGFLAGSSGLGLGVGFLAATLGMGGFSAPLTLGDLTFLSISEKRVNRYKMFFIFSVH